jgi:glycosyltransferase involved in cell wall biosynthesis
VKIFGWLGDHGGCAWYRVILPLRALREHGIQTKWGTSVTGAGGGPAMDPDDTDIVIIQRPTLSGPTMILRKMAQAENRPRIVVELDDDLLAVDRTNRKEVYEYYNRADVRANLANNLRLADLVTVSTEPLAERVRKYNQNVVVLPNCVPAEMLTWIPGRYTSRYTVGWAGSATHDGDWRTATEPVRLYFDQARASGVPIELHTIGSLPSTLPQVYPHRHTAGLEIDAYYRAIDWHVALAPLADTKFNRSKSHLRPLEAAMLGLPVVASNVQAYGQFVQHGKTGFLVDGPADWGEYLQLLATDHDLRQQMSQNARELAQSHTIEANIERWLEAYRACLES